MFMLGNSILQWREKKVGETQATKSAAKIFYPSVTMMPLLDHNYSKAKLDLYNTTKNLTEYNLKSSHVYSNILSISQSYNSANG